MKTLRRSLSVLLCLALLLLLPLPASAAGPIDLGRPCSLTLTYLWDRAPISGAAFDLYRAADVDEYAAYTLTEDFSAYQVRLEGLTTDGWRALAKTLAGYALRDGLAPLCSGTTDQSGVLRFRDLTPGLYLVVGHMAADAAMSYTSEPFLLALPGSDTASNGWTYDVEAAPKAACEPLPAEPVRRSVLKVWDDGGSSSRPASVTVRLLAGDKVYDTVTLRAENNWRHDWTDLPASDDRGAPIDWRIAEDTVPGYTASVSREDTTFILTNQAPSAQPPAKLPQTGLLWWPVPLFTAAGLLCLLLGRRRARRG